MKKDKKQELNFVQELSTITLFHLYGLSRSGLGHLINWCRGLDVSNFEEFLNYIVEHNIRDESAFKDYVAQIDRVNVERVKFEKGKKLDAEIDAVLSK